MNEHGQIYVDLDGTAPMIDLERMRLAEKLETERSKILDQKVDVDMVTKAEIERILGDRDAEGR